MKKLRFKTHYEQIPEGSYLSIEQIPKQIREWKSEYCPEIQIHKTIKYKYPFGDEVYMSTTLNGFIEFWFD